jgi:outer membrane protein assembly factor BamA
MKTIAWLSVLLLTLVRPAFAQQTEPPDGAKIVTAQVSGIDASRLSPGLQEAINKLAGTTLDRAQLKELVARIEAEQPRFAAALKITGEPDGGARVVFVVARMRDPEHQANVNAKYPVDEVDIRGVPDKDIPADLRKDVEALKGKPLDPDEAERLHARLRAAFPEYEVSRQTSRGEKSGTITVVFSLHRSEWSRPLRFEPLKANALYHSDQGWGGYLDVGGGDGNWRVTPIFALDTADDLPEEYSGLGVRFETRKLGTERLGASLEWTWFENSWRAQTVAALAFNPTLPPLYDDRTSLTPLIKFAITRQLWISGGVSIAELDPLDPLDLDCSCGIDRSQMANAVVGTIGYNLLPRSSKARDHHAFDVTFNVRSGMHELESDVEYTRSLAQAGYSYHEGNHRVLISGMGGVINGSGGTTAPIFERFTLGDSRTLRGWNKYDISPAGADRMIYGSVEYRYQAFAMFLDAGSVWNNGTERKFRVSTGVGIISGPFFMTLGFPVNTSDFRAVFSIGVHAPFVFHKF